MKKKEMKTKVMAVAMSATMAAAFVRRYRRWR